MLTRAILSLIVLCATAGIFPAQGTNSPVGLPDDIEQNETMRDTLKRMQIKREESDFQKLVEKSLSIRDGARKLAAELKSDAAPALIRQHDKLLRDMEKFARQIRADSGGSDDGESEVVKGGIEEVIAQLVNSSERLNDSLTKTSRRIISVSVIEACSEVIDLARELRLRLRQAAL
jgi:uncharacterized phage infection (PIP) family protein YhgE